MDAGNTMLLHDHCVALKQFLIGRQHLNLFLMEDQRTHTSLSTEQHLSSSSEVRTRFL